MNKRYVARNGMDSHGERCYNSRLIPALRLVQMTLFISESRMTNATY